MAWGWKMLGWVKVGGIIFRDFEPWKKNNLGVLFPHSGKQRQTIYLDVMTWHIYLEGIQKNYYTRIYTIFRIRINCHPIRLKI